MKQALVLALLASLYMVTSASPASAELGPFQPAAKPTDTHYQLGLEPSKWDDESDKRVLRTGPRKTDTYVATELDSGAGVDCAMNSGNPSCQAAAAGEAPAE